MNQMKKLRQCLNTTITRYTKRQGSRPTQMHTSQNKNGYNSPKKLVHSKNKRHLEAFNPQIIEVTKLKLYPSNGINQKMKSQYTVPRGQIKAYIKIRTN